MFTIDQYVKVQSLSEAYELAQKKTATILGGCGWLKMGRRPIQTAIDLSGLGLDQIQETDGYFELGCMATLRQIETSKALAACFGDCIAECLRHIVGVQFRNCATIGGSIWGRFGFSDPLTLFLALDAEVCLYRGGVIPLRDFVRMDYDRDVLAAVRLPKRGQKAVYLTHRASATDFPVLACAVCRFPAGSGGNGFRAAVAPAARGAHFRLGRHPGRRRDRPQRGGVCRLGGRAVHLCVQYARQRGVPPPSDPRAYKTRPFGAGGVTPWQKF